MPDNDPTGPPDGDGRGTGGNAGEFVVVVFALVVGFFAIASMVGAIASAAGKPAGPGICTESCYGFVRTECPGDRYIGACFGFHFCDGPPHACGTNP